MTKIYGVKFECKKVFFVNPAPGADAVDLVRWWFQCVSLQQLIQRKLRIIDQTLTGDQFQ